MIPTINDILDDLVEGKITKQQAVAWIDAHLEGEYEAGQDSMVTKGTGREGK